MFFPDLFARNRSIFRHGIRKRSEIKANANGVIIRVRSVNGSGSEVSQLPLRVLWETVDRKFCNFRIG
jgi:hypothetical protein